jgi:hypothetical protein
MYTLLPLAAKQNEQTFLPVSCPCATRLDIPAVERLDLTNGCDRQYIENHSLGARTIVVVAISFPCGKQNRRYINHHFAEVQATKTQSITNS